MTTAPILKPPAFDALLSQSWALFKRNWVIAVPPFIAAAVAMIVLIVLVVVCVFAAIAHGSPDHWSGGFIASLVGAYLLFLVVALVAGLWASIATYAMADAAWERGVATLGDGMAAFGARAGATLALFVGYVGLAIVAVILLLPTLGLSVLVLPFATMYAMPAVVSGRRGGFDAIKESFQLVRAYFGASAIVYLVLYAIAYGISLLMIAAIVPLEFATISSSADTPHLPPIGLLGFSGTIYAVTLVALIAYNGFHTVALVGMYRALIALPRHEALPRPGGAIVQP